MKSEKSILEELIERAVRNKRAYDDDLARKLYADGAKSLSALAERCPSSKDGLHSNYDMTYWGGAERQCILCGAS